MLPVYSNLFLTYCVVNLLYPLLKFAASLGPEPKLVNAVMLGYYLIRCNIVMLGYYPIRWNTGMLGYYPIRGEYFHFGLLSDSGGILSCWVIVCKQLY